MDWHWTRSTARLQGKEGSARARETGARNMHVCETTMSVMVCDGVSNGLMVLVIVVIVCGCMRLWDRCYRAGAVGRVLNGVRHVHRPQLSSFRTDAVCDELKPVRPKVQFAASDNGRRTKRAALHSFSRNGLETLLDSIVSCSSQQPEIKKSQTCTCRERAILQVVVSHVLNRSDALLCFVSSNASGVAGFQKAPGFCNVLILQGQRNKTPRVRLKPVG